MLLQVPRHAGIRLDPFLTPLFTSVARRPDAPTSLPAANDCVGPPTSLRQSPQFALPPNPLSRQNSSVVNPMPNQPDTSSLGARLILRLVAALTLLFFIAYALDLT